jgi:hypothetical protein
MLRADSATVEWNEQKKRWEVHVHVGAEVIKRPLPKYTGSGVADDAKAEAVTIARDEGYEVTPAQVTVRDR